VQSITLFYDKINDIMRTGIFIHQGTVSAVRRVELVSDGMSHMIIRGCR